MTKTFVDGITQLDLLIDATKWLSKQTGVPAEELQNHMMVLSNVARVMEKYGSIYGEPTVSDYLFDKRDWDDTFDLISQIWHE